MSATKYLNLERITTTTFRLALYVDAKGLEQFLYALKLANVDAALSEQVKGNDGYIRTVATPLGDL